MAIEPAGYQQNNRHRNSSLIFVPMQGRFLLILLLWVQALNAQRVQTVVPTGAVIAGTAFQVQYLVTNPNELASFTPPNFNPFRVVSGPNRYMGFATVDGKVEPILNITYTLVAPEPGRQPIPKLKVEYRNGSMQEAPETSVLVSPPPKASFSARSSNTDLSLVGALTPAERERLAEENLFVRATVNKRTVFLGEPVLATFQLYSRLQSQSELERAPSLYGFSVVDVLDINRAHQEVETINGQVFNTYILRKALLYPGSDGRLTVDEMVINSEAEFTDSGTGNHTIRRQLKTVPIPIRVLPLPQPAPDSFEGAVGRFRIRAWFERATIAVEEQGRLVLEVTGSGNFLQMTPPDIHWPSGFETFEPQIVDSLHNDSTTTYGSRRYIYPFSAINPGAYAIAPLRLDYYDLNTKGYETLLTDSTRVEVRPEKKAPVRNTVTGSNEGPDWLLPLLGGLVLAGGLWLFFYRMRKREKRNEAPPVKVEAATPYQRLQALDLSSLNEREAFVRMQGILVEARSMFPAGTDGHARIRALIDECQLQTYASVTDAGKAEDLRGRALQVLKDAQ